MFAFLWDHPFSSAIQHHHCGLQVTTRVPHFDGPCSQGNTIVVAYRNSTRNKTSVFLFHVFHMPAGLDKTNKATKYKNKQAGSRYKHSCHIYQMPIYRRVTGFCEKCYDTAHAKITNSHSKPRGASSSETWPGQLQRSPGHARCYCYPWNHHRGQPGHVTLLRRYYIDNPNSMEHPWMVSLAPEDDGERSQWLPTHLWAEDCFFVRMNTMHMPLTTGRLFRRPCQS